MATDFPCARLFGESPRKGEKRLPVVSPLPFTVSFGTSFGVRVARNEGVRDGPFASRRSRAVNRRPPPSPLAEALAAMPDADARLVAEHRDDGSGHCRVCRIGGHGGWPVWPCALFCAADAAVAVVRERRACRQGP